MDSGSLLQVAKLAQMCPAAPSSAQRHPNGAERCQTVPNGAEWCQTVPNDGALCSNKIIFEPIILFFHPFKKKGEKGPSPRGPQEALGA